MRERGRKGEVGMKGRARKEEGVERDGGGRGSGERGKEGGREGVLWDEEFKTQSLHKTAPG